MINSANPSTKASLNEKTNILSVLKGILAAYVITVPVFMLFSLLLTNIDFPQRLIMPVVVVTTIISVLFAGSIAAKGAKSRGWLNGGIVGLIYMIVLYIISSLVFKNFEINRYVLTMAVIGMLTGAIGGIIGINVKKSPGYKRSRG